MSKEILHSVSGYDFSSLTLNQPYAMQGGSYFTKLLSGGQQLYVQTPKCMTRQGIVNSGQKMYVDLVFDHKDSEFVDWVNGIETAVQGLIYEKRQLWFHNDLDMSDIETAFSSPVKVLKSGSSYLLRANIGRTQNLACESAVRIFDENEIDLKITDITQNTPVIAILEISGIRFSSRSFHIDISVKQMMAMQNFSTFDQCMIDIGGHSGTAMSDYVEVDESGRTDDETQASVNESDQEQEMDDEQHVVKPVSPEPEAAGPETTTGGDEGDVPPPSDPQPVATTPIADGTLAATDGDVPQSEPMATVEPSVTDDGSLEEVNVDPSKIRDSVTIKNPNEVYMELYLRAREKAKLAKKAALDAYMEAKNIRKTYLLDELEDSDEESEEE